MVSSVKTNGKWNVISWTCDKCNKEIRSSGFNGYLPLKLPAPCNDYCNDCKSNKSSCEIDFSYEE